MRKAVLLGAALMAVSVAGAAVSILEPADGSMVPLLTDAQKAYLGIPRAERREKFANSKFRKKEMGLPAEKLEGEKHERKSYWPKTVKLAWTAKDGAECRVSVKDAQTGVCVYEGTTKNGLVNIDNLEIATEYEWTVDDGEGAAKAKFKTEDTPLRLVRFPGVPNVRDLGGRIGLGGKRVKQGLVFRSAGLNENASSTYFTKEELEQLGRQDEAKDGKRVAKERKPGASRVEGENGAYILKRFGIKSDIDLRSDKECFGMTGSPLGESVTWFHYSSSAYGGLQADHGRKSFTKVFKVFLDKKNYPIDFHCIAGQDRTGSVAFVLNALLGVDEEQLYLDWEVTGFWNRSAGFCHEKLFDKLVEGFKKNYPAETINESVEKYVLSLGFTAEDIATFRAIML